MALHRKQNMVQQKKNILRHFGSKTQCKNEAKIGANLEEKIGTYLEVKHGAKWDAKVVEKCMQYWMLIQMLTWCY